MEEEKKQKAFVQKPIRTYESDIAEALGKGASVASVVIAENKRKNEERKSKEEEELDKADKLAEKATDSLQKEIEGISKPDVTAPPPPPPRSKPVLPINPAPDIVKSSPIIDAVPNIERSEFHGFPNPVPIPKPIPIQKPIEIEKAKVVQIDDNEPEVKRNIIKPLFIIILIIIFFGGGVLGIYYTYERSQSSGNSTVIENKIIVPSIINPDKQMNWNTDQINKNKFVSELYLQFNKNKQKEKKILEIIPKNNSSIVNNNNIENSGIENINTIGETLSISFFLEKSNVSMPDNILRSILDKYMLGLYTEETGEVTPFIILTTDFFQNTFAGMLSWEKTMPDSLASLLNYKDRARNDDTASTSISSYFTIKGNFIDKQIMNRDIREFRNPEGELLFLYSFINKNALIITTTESTFIEIIKRIEKQTYIR